MFNGASASLPSFSLNMREKLCTNADQFLTKQAKVDYVDGRLVGKALDIIRAQPNKNTEHLTITMVAALLTLLLQTAFGDPDVIRTAHRISTNSVKGNRTMPPTMPT